MTISYNGDISSSRTFSFMRIIMRWKGSIWKSVFVELVSWVFMYFVTMFVYRHLMSETQRRLFAKFAQYSNATIDYLPLTFMLGFFVSIVVDRWKNIFANIGFIDDAAIYASCMLTSQEEGVAQKRRNVLRYLILTQVLVLRDISLQVRKRFPSMEAIVNAGFMMPHEKKLMDQVTDEYNRYWLPIHWSCTIVQKCREDNHIKNDAQTNGLLKEIINFRSNLQVLCNYDWVPVPLAYPQVVFMAVRVYFTICLICRQYLFPGDTVTRTVYTMIDLKVPVMTMLQFIFYMGWMKVAEALLNPLGEDDDDLECNYIIDRNATIAMYLAGPCNGVVPEPKPDSFTYGYTPLYSEDTASQVIHPLIGSAASLMPDLPNDSSIKMVPLNDDATSRLSFKDENIVVSKFKKIFGLRNRVNKLFARKPQKAVRRTSVYPHISTPPPTVVPIIVTPPSSEKPEKKKETEDSKQEVEDPKVTVITCNDDREDKRNKTM